MNTWKDEIAKSLANVSGVEIEDAYSSLCQPRGGQADWCSTLAFNVAKKEKKNPAMIAGEWAKNSKWPSIIEKVEATGPYLNFYFTKQFWKKLLDEFCSGKRDFLDGKKIIVEFPSVNPNKPWHVGHLRNAILGDSLAKVLEYCKNDVRRIDYIDDLGLQVAQSYWGEKNLSLSVDNDDKYSKKADHVCGWKYVQVSKKFEDEKIAKQVREILKQMEKGDNEVALEAREFAEEIVRAQYETAFLLGIYHDALVFESDILKRVFEQGIEKIKKSGALVFEKEGKNANCWVIKLEGAAGFEGLENADKILIRSDGTVTYTGKDVAFQMWKFGLLDGDFDYCKFIEQPNDKVALKTCEIGEKKEFGKADMVVNVIGVEQSYPQQVIGAVLQKMGFEKEAKNSIHLAYEHVVLPQGKFSGRKGTWMKKEGEELGFSADELIDEVIKRAKERIEGEYSDEKKDEIAKAVGIAALRFSFLRAGANMKIVFDVDRALSLSGDSGPYVQYTYARATNILNKSKEENNEVDVENYEFSQKETELLRVMLRWNETVLSCQKNLVVHPICDYAIELAGAFNKFYTDVQVLSEKDGNKRKIRLLEVKAYKSLLAQTMGILGFEPVERM